MLASKLNFGIPDLDLEWTGGGTVNPSCFAGHQLLVVFLPVDEQEQGAEFDSYERLSEEPCATDAWFLVVAPEPPKGGQKRSVPIAHDPTGRAWAAFNRAANVKLDRSKGAAFLFTRGGGFRRVWPGRGHVADVVRELFSRG